MTPHFFLLFLSLPRRHTYHCFGWLGKLWAIVDCIFVIYFAWYESRTWATEKESDDSKSLNKHWRKIILSALKWQRATATSSFVGDKLEIYGSQNSILSVLVNFSYRNKFGAYSSSIPVTNLFKMSLNCSGLIVAVWYNAEVSSPVSVYYTDTKRKCNECTKPLFSTLEWKWRKKITHLITSPIDTCSQIKEN